MWPTRLGLATPACALAALLEAAAGSGSGIILAGHDGQEKAENRDEGLEDHFAGSWLRSGYEFE